MPAVAVHFRALPYREVAAALAAVEGGAGALAARACLRFLALTGARVGRSEARDVERGRPGRARVAHSRRADEARARTSGAAV